MLRRPAPELRVLSASRPTTTWRTVLAGGGPCRTWTVRLRAWAAGRSRAGRAPCWSIPGY